MRFDSAESASDFPCALGNEEALRRQQQMPDDQQGSGSHQLDPHAGTDHQPVVGADKRREQDRGRGRADSGGEARQQDDEIERHQDEGAERGIAAPGRGHEEMFLQDRGHRVRQRQYRRHRRRDRRHLCGANTGRRRPDQHDLVLVFAGGDLAESTS